MPRGVQAQADKLDHRAFYQARNLRQEVAETMATQLRLNAATAEQQAAALIARLLS